MQGISFDGVSRTFVDALSRLGLFPLRNAGPPIASLAVVSGLFNGILESEKAESKIIGADSRLLSSAELDKVGEQTDFDPFILETRDAFVSKNAPSCFKGDVTGDGFLRLFKYS